MELKALRLFVILADELHFGRSAKRAGITQSALSVKIKRLEDELGAPLFTRSTREVKLTDVGVIFREEALGVLRHADQALGAARAAATGKRRVIRIGITAAVELSSLMDRVADFRIERPEVQVLIEELGTIDQEAALAAGDIDIGLLHPPLDQSDLLTETLTVDRFCAVFHPTFFNLGSGSTLEDLLSEPLVFYPRRRAPRLYDRLIGLATGLGLTANIVAEAESFLAAVAMARAGLGVGLVPNQLATIRPDLSALPLPDEVRLSLTTASAIHKRRSDDPAIKACLKCLQDPGGRQRSSAR